MPETDVVVAFVSGPDAGTLLEIGEALVESGHAACVTVIEGTTSVYRWQGRVAREGEAVAMVKMVRSQVEAVARRIHDLHPYDLPEFVVLPVVDGDAGYLDWVRSAAKGSVTETSDGSS